MTEVERALIPRVEAQRQLLVLVLRELAKSRGATMREDWSDLVAKAIDADQRFPTFGYEGMRDEAKDDAGLLLKEALKPPAV